MSETFSMPEQIEFTAPDTAGDGPLTIPATEPEAVPEESLASPFLAKIPPADRAVVARYIKDWDANVTKKFMDYSGRIKAYEALGPVDELQRYLNVINSIRRDPENFFRVMWQGLSEQYPDDFEAQLARILQIEGMEMAELELGDEEEYAGNGQPDPNEVFQQNVMSELEELRAWRQQQEQERTQAEENRQLDTVLSTMHTRYGQFDDNWILVRIAEHGDPDRAIKEWHAMLGKYSQGQKPQPPKTMGGSGGGVPSGQVDTKALRGKERRDTVANMLAALGE